MEIFKKLSSFHVKLYKTCILWATFFVLGCSIAIIGPTLLDLQIAIDASLQTTGFAVPGRALGYVLGSTVGGLVPSKMPKENVLAFCLLAFCFIFGLAPWCRSVYTLVAALGISGFFMGITEVVANVYTFDLWPKRTAIVAQVNYLFFGTGALVAPFLAQPFLLPLQKSEVEGETSNTTTTTFYTPEDVRIQYPYDIVAIFAICLSSSFLVFHLFSVETYQDSECSPLLGEKAESTSKLKKTCIIVVVCLFVHLYCGLEIAFGTMLEAYLVEGEAKLTKSTAAFMTCAFWGLYTVFKVVPIIFASLVPEFHFLVFEILALTAGNLVLFSSSPLCLWIGVSLVGLGLSSVWGLMLGYIHQFIELSGRTLSFFLISACLGELIYPLIVAGLVEKYPRTFLIVSNSCSFSLTLTFIFLVVMCHQFFHKKP